MSYKLVGPCAAFILSTAFASDALAQGELGPCNPDGGPPDPRGRVCGGTCLAVEDTCRGCEGSCGCALPGSEFAIPGFSYEPSIGPPHLQVKQKIGFEPTRKTGSACEVETAVRGELAACWASSLWSEDCVRLTGAAQSTCRASNTCKGSGISRCVRSGECCETQYSGGLGGSRELSIGKTLTKVWAFDAKAEGKVTVEVSGNAKITSTDGEGCPCNGMRNYQFDITERATGAVELQFPFSGPKQALKIELTGCVRFGMHVETCGGTEPSKLGGSKLEFKGVGLHAGWFTFQTSKSLEWVGGDGC